MEPASIDQTPSTWNFSQKSRAFPVKNRRGKTISSGKAKSRISFFPERCAEGEKNLYAVAVKTFSKQENCRLGRIEKRFYFLCLVDGEYYKVNKKSLKKRFNLSEDLWQKFTSSKDKDLVALAGSVLLTTEGTEASQNTEPFKFEPLQSEVTLESEENESPSALEEDCSWVLGKFEEYFPDRPIKSGQFIPFPKNLYEVEKILLKSARTGVEESAIVYTRGTNDYEIIQFFVLDSNSDLLGHVTLKQETYVIEGSEVSYLNIESFNVPGVHSSHSGYISKQTDYPNLLSYFLYIIKDYSDSLGFDGRVSLSDKFKEETFWYSHGFRYLSCPLRDKCSELSKEKCRELDEIVRKKIEGTYDKTKDDPQGKNFELALSATLYYAEVSEEVTMWNARKGCETKSAR